MTIAAATYKSLPPILKQVPITHLDTLLDKPAPNYQLILLKRFVTLQMQEHAIPSDETPLNSSRYRTNKRWISLSIEQANLQTDEEEILRYILQFHQNKEKERKLNPA